MDALIFLAMSLTYIRNNRGPKIDASMFLFPQGAHSR